MNLSHLSDQKLLSQTQVLATQERELLIQVCYHLREIERRRLFAALKYQSLMDYAIYELKYSETQAVRRISAMRLLSELPEIETDMASGQINLTNATLAQTLFSKEKKSGRTWTREQKLQIVNGLKNRSTREAKKLVGAINPEMKLKPLTYDMIEDDLLREKLLQLKGQFAHTNPNLSLHELLHKLCDLVLGKSTPAKPRLDSQAEIIREVRRRAGHRCENCNSRYALEIDHIQPKSLGGQDMIENLRLLCRTCNQRASIEKLGHRRMAKYLKSPTRAYG